jgi:hypothetical protein
MLMPIHSGSLMLPALRLSGLHRGRLRPVAVVPVAFSFRDSFTPSDSTDEVAKELVTAFYGEESGAAGVARLLAVTSEVTFFAGVEVTLLVQRFS